MPRGYYKNNQNRSKKISVTAIAHPTIDELVERKKEALLKEDRNKMTVSDLRRLVDLLEERTKRDR